MGYDIRPIAEIEEFDKSLCYGYPNVNLHTNISIDGLLFIVGGATLNEYTYAEILAILETPNWNRE